MSGIETTGLRVDPSRCTGCGACLRACASGGIELVGERPHRTARPTEACVLCGLCVQACPFGAIGMVQPEAPANDDAEPRGEHGDMWVFAQVDDGKPVPAAFELLGKGRELADVKGHRLVALLGLGIDVETDADAAARSLVANGADEVLLCRDERLAGHETEAFASWICDLVEERGPDILLFGATDFGRELAPSVAARVRTGLTADCTELRIDPDTGLLQQTRPAFGGNLMATIVCPAHRPQMATVRPGVLPSPISDPTRQGAVAATPFPQIAPPRVRILSTLPSSSRDTVADADVLVVAGRGIGSQKNLSLVQRLADLLGGKLGCTRPLVEAGWCEYWHQVGQTGCSVAPRLLVSVGVSGAIQHLAGIGGAQTVVAINTDPDAPIFGVSDYNVVGDCIEVVKELVSLLEASDETA